MTFTEAMKGIYKEKALDLSRKNAQLRAVCQRAVENNGVLVEEDLRWLTEVFSNQDVNANETTMLYTE